MFQDVPWWDTRITRWLDSISNPSSGDVTSSTPPAPTMFPPAAASAHGSWNPLPTDSEPTCRSSPATVDRLLTRIALTMSKLIVSPNTSFTPLNRLTSTCPAADTVYRFR